MNTTILRAQLWELWRLTWGDIVVRIGGTFAYFWLFTLLPDGVTDYLQGIVLIVVVLASLVSGLWLNSYDRWSRGGFPFSLGYTRPIPTFWLVSVPLTWLLISNALIFLVLMRATEMVFAWNLPQLSLLPVVLLGTALVALVAWCTTGRAEREIAATAVCVGALWLCVEAAALLDPLKRGASVRVTSHAPDLQTCVILMVGALVAVSLIFLAIRQLRSGGRAPALGGRSFFQVLSRHDGERVDAFYSARHAQWWFDLRRAGSRARAIVLTGLILLLIASWGASEFGGESLMAILWGASVIITPLAVLGGTVDGVLGLNHQGTNSRLAIYEAIRPVTIRHNILQKLGFVLGITLPGWTMFALGALVVDSVFWGGIMRDLTAFLSRDDSVAALQMAGFIVAGYVLATATCIAFALLLMSAGYVAPRLKEHPVACWVFAVAVAVSLALPVVEALTGWGLTGVVHACQILWGLFFIGATIRSLWRAGHEGFYTVPWLCCAAVAWALLLAALSGAAIYTGADIPDLTPYTAVLAAGLLCIPLASVAWAPLSLAALRHQ